MLPDDSQNSYWDVQISIAEAIACLPKPSLAKLHHDILEEIGKRPSLKLTDYFLSITKISKEEREEYFKYIGMSDDADVKTVQEVTETTNKSSYLQLADTIASGDAPTVLKLRQAYIEEYDEPPSTKLIEYFLKKIQSVPHGTIENGGKQEKLDFVQQIAGSPNPTVLTFRKRFIAQFGSSPSNELTEYFLKILQKISSNSVDETPGDDFDSKVVFAKTVARGLISTILQFREAFKKAYGETPSADLIDVFIKNLPSTNND